MTWQFILTDLLGNTHGEITEASSRKVTLPHLRVPSVAFTVALTNQWATQLLDTDCLVRAYRISANGTKTLAFNGPVVSAEENADESSKTIAVTAAGPFWRLTKRLIPASKLKTGVQYGAAGALYDLGYIAQQVLVGTNAAQFTGIDLGSLTNSISGWVGPWYLKNSAEAIAELAAGLNSFEMRVTPTENTAYANPNNYPRIGLLDIAPIIGVSRPDAVFEYGTGQSNVATYNRKVSRETLLTNALCSVSGWPDSVEKWDDDANPNTAVVDKYHLVERGDATTIASHGLFEEVVDDVGILDDGLRQGIADFHIGVRKNPRQLIVFKPVVNADPTPLEEYLPGDTVRARAVVDGILRFDANFRIWGVNFDIDQNGNESVELELVMP